MEEFITNIKNIDTAEVLVYIAMGVVLLVILTLVMMMVR